MTATPDLPELHIVLRSHVNRYSDGGYVNFTAGFGYEETKYGERQISYPRFGYDEPYLALASFSVTAQANTDDDSPWYAIEVGYHEPSCVQLEQAQLMVATLRRLERHDAKLTQKFGDPVGLAGRLARVADCFGVTSFCWPSDRSLSGDGYHHTDVRGMGWHLDEVLRDARPKKQAA